MEYVFIGLAASGALSLFIMRCNAGFKKTGNTSELALVRPENIRSVCKITAVKGDFAIIYQDENLKDKLVNILRGKQKPIILMNSKAHTGLDLTQIRMDSDTGTRTTRLTRFLQPQITSIETDFKYDDKTAGWLKYLTGSGLTAVNRNAKQHAIDNIPERGLLEQARKEARNTNQLIKSLADAIVQKLAYTVLILAAPRETNKLIPLYAHR